MQTKNINIERAPANTSAPPPEIVVAALAAVAIASPIGDQLVEVSQDTHGNYKFYYKTIDATRTEEGHSDGSVVGSVSYIDPTGGHQTLHYTSGVSGYDAQGAAIPTPVHDLPEVAHARGEHAAIFEQVKSLLPPLREDGTVAELPETPLSVPEFLKAVSAVLNRNTPLVFLEDTPEVSEAKAEHYKAQAAALGN